MTAFRPAPTGPKHGGVAWHGHCTV